MTDKKVKHKKYTDLNIECDCIKKKKLKSDNTNVPFSTFKKNLNFKLINWKYVNIVEYDK